MIAITLPLPPSANTRLTRNRRLTEDARNYMTQVGWLCRAQDIEPLQGKRLKIEIDVYVPTRSSDLDNREKLLLDSLTGHLWIDDRYIYDKHTRKHIDKQNPRIELRVMEITE